MNNEQIRLKLIGEADKANAKYPQYKGHFDNYSLAMAIKDIKNKQHQIIFKAGDHLLINKQSIHKPEIGPYMNTFFIYGVSPITYIDTSIRLKDIKVQE